MNRRSVVQADPGIKPDPSPKIIKAKRAGEVTQEVEYLPSKHETLS
jgi:hypothetical protein